MILKYYIKLLLILYYICYIIILITWNIKYKNITTVLNKTKMQNKNLNIKMVDAPGYLN